MGGGQGDAGEGGNCPIVNKTNVDLGLVHFLVFPHAEYKVKKAPSSRDY